MVLVAIVWKIHRHRHPFIDASGKGIINYICSIILYLFIIDSITLANCGFPYFPRPTDGQEFAFIAVLANLLLLLLTLVKVAQAVDRTANGIVYRYPDITIRFLR